MENTQRLINKQSEIVAFVQQMERNFKKDSSERKSPSYLLKKLSILEDNWQLFQMNDSKINECEVQEGPYFDIKVFDQMKGLYLRFRSMILNYESTEAGKAMPEHESDLKTLELVNEQRSNIRAFERAISQLDIRVVQEKWQLEDELRTITMRWETVDKLFWKLDILLPNSDKQDYQDEYNRLEQLYKLTRKEINTKIWSNIHQEKSAPKIEIPYFNGSYLNWTTFKDIFTETVHLNPLISPAQKMQHLKAKLKGDAEKLVQHLTISADNYATCWDILNHRYDNHRILFTQYATTLLNQPIINRPNAIQIKKLHDTTLECLHGITNLDVDTSSWDPLIVHILVQKLDKETTEQYIESLKAPRGLPGLSDFLSFLELKFMALESANKSNYLPHNNSHAYNNFKLQGNNNNNFNRRSFYPFMKKPASNDQKPSTSQKSFHTTSNGWSCPHCKKSHGLYTCREFLEMTPEKRLTTVEKLNLCKNCLFSHNGRDCYSKNTCKNCNSDHSTLLHDAISKQSTLSMHRQNQRASHYASYNEPAEVLLATAQIKIKGINGDYLTFRALLDQGSQLSLITESAAQQLQLKRTRCDATVMGLGAISSNTNRSKGMVRLECQSTNSNYETIINALVMNKITNKLPNISFSTSGWTSIEHLVLADPHFNMPGNIDVLLGADMYSDLIMEGLVRSEITNIIAQQTRLGWVVSGKLKRTYNCHIVLNSIKNLDRFWEQEEINEEKIQSTNSLDTCEKQYIETTTRLADGRYEVTLPMKPGFEGSIGNSKSRAIAIFKQLEQRMGKNEKLKQDYCRFMEEYRDLGHMIEAPKNTQTFKNKHIEFFMPHHGVIREEAVTTKLRVVFNASGKSTSGYSLNDVMECGVNLQADLQTLLLQWRQYRYVLTADIEKMFRYIAVRPDYQRLQRIVWRDSPKQSLREYQLCTVTYGTKAAPYLAQRTLKQLAADEGDNYPNAKPILQHQFYMDDTFFGNNTLQEARIARDELIQLLKAGGFNLRKWSSNEERLVKDLPEDLRDPRNYSFTENETSKTLGLGWNPKNDQFVYSSPYLKLANNETVYTKRRLLSEIAKIFDPLGWLSPITIKAKLLFQKVWAANILWDDQLTPEIHREWLRIRDDMINIQHFKVPRWLGYTDANIEVELHAFSDASEKAYSAVAYSAVRASTEEPILNLIAAKTKVSPLKHKQTLPRLELNGALLLSKLVNKIKTSFDNKKIKIYAYTDSMVVLGWINGDANKWNSYIASRVKEITSVIPKENWKHVKSELNPADCASRGLLPSQLLNFSLWWEGPTFLRDRVKHQQNNMLYITNMETKKQVNLVQSSPPDSMINNLLNKNNTIFRAARTLAWVLRFITRTCRHLSDETKIASHKSSLSSSLTITMNEIRYANTTIIKYVQSQCYATELHNLKTKGTVNNNSKILKLNPRLDENGLIVVGGRLRNSYLNHSTKYPIILPQKHRLSELIIEEAHQATLHGGVRVTLNYLRQKYWIPGGLNIIKGQLRRCVKCARYNTTKQTQLMGNLPKARVTPSRPFYNCGVDFAGPVDIKINKGRGVKTSKGYIAVFICLATKAVHLEVVSDLTSNAFLAALKRMVSRRGIPKHIYSDCGTNFVGANRELIRQFKLEQTFNSDSFNINLSKTGIEWHFNAPAWPSAGGIWEAAVKSMKYHLKRVIGEQKLTYEEFSTLLTQVEACLNSRPLIALTEDTDDLECVLTPGHFLVGEHLTALPEESYEKEVTLKTRWQLVQKMVQHFWKRWSSEYLHNLQTRSKWHKEQPNMKENDIVLIKEDYLAPSRWAMARVTQVHPGNDNLVRVVSLKTKHGTLKRPITKLIKLPVDEETIQQQETKNRREEKSNKRHNIQFCTPRTSGKRSCRSKTVNFLLCLALTIFMLIPGSQQQNISPMNVSPFESERQVYYDELGQMHMVHDSWKILTFYNMTSYWQGINNIPTYVSHVDRVCKGFDYQGLCDSIVTELSQEVQELKHNNMMLQKHYLQIRKKRGLVNGVGQLAHYLFGVLDENFAEQYYKDISNLKTNENHLLSLLKNQTSIIEAHNNIIQRNEITMNKQFNLMEQHITRADQRILQLSSKQEQSLLMNYFNSIALSTNIILTKLRKIQDSVSTTLSNINKGIIDTTLISQEQIYEQLQLIAVQLPKHVSLPVEDLYHDLPEVYKLLHVRARIFNNYLIMEIKLPLISDIQYQLYKIIPVPIIFDKKAVMFTSQMQYVAINLLRDFYINVEQDDFQNCIIQKENKYICTLNRPIHNMRKDDLPCELSFIAGHNNKTCSYKTNQCNNQWIGLHRLNTWLYICCDECQLQTVCNNGYRLTTRTVTRSGTVTLNAGCTLKKDDTIIHTDTEYHSKIYISPTINMPILSDLNNLTKLWPLETLQSIKEDHTSTFTEINKQLQTIKEQSEDPIGISSNDIHQYTVSYLTLTLFALGMIGGCYLWRKRKQQMQVDRVVQRTAMRQDNRAETIEMDRLQSALRVPSPPSSTPLSPSNLIPVYAIPQRVVTKNHQ